MWGFCKLQFMRAVLFFLFACCSICAEKPLAVYLTWIDNPLTTIEVMWLTTNADCGQLTWNGQTIEALHKNLPQLPATLHQVSLKGLTPGEKYSFSLEDEKYQFSMPRPELPCHFIVGGDCYHDEKEIYFKMLRTIAEKKPDFVVFGGDLAYSVQKKAGPEHPERWITFLSGLTDYMKKGDELIPVLTAIGNHELLGGYGQTPEKASLYYSLFPGNGFRKLQFDHYLNLFILDSGHTHEIAGAQTEWLKKALENPSNIPYSFAVYHVPAFPTVRPYTYSYSKEIRKNWVPLFETFKLTAAFEHHDHTLKRTFPILNKDAVKTGGVVYFGDGTCGVGDPRVPKEVGTVWYLAYSKQAQAVWDVTLTKEKALFQAISADGTILDKTEISPHLGKSTP